MGRDVHLERHPGAIFWILGDPFARQWGPQLQTPRHSVQARWSDFPILDVVYVTLQMQASSSQRFTPMIATDVNGDGAFNDRPFRGSINTAKCMRGT